MINLINVIIAINTFIVAIFIYLLYRLGMWKLLPKEGKAITLILLAYMATNRITDIITDDIFLRTKVTVISTTIYMIILLVILTKFYRRITEKINEEKINEEKDVRLQ